MAYGILVRRDSNDPENQNAVVLQNPQPTRKLLSKVANSFQQCTPMRIQCEASVSHPPPDAP
jgi:hypothetical protein